MKQEIENIYIKLEAEKLFDENLTLYLLDIPTEKELNKCTQQKNSPNDFWVFARGYNDMLKIDSSFDVIFPKTNPFEGIKTNAIIKYISINPTYEIDYLPSGYSGICLIEFTNGLPYILNKLSIYGEKKNSIKHDTLILTQTISFERVLEEFKNKIPRLQ